MKHILLVLLVLYSEKECLSFTSKADSLEKVIRTEKKNSGKIEPLIELSNYYQEDSISASFQYAHRALALSEKNKDQGLLAKVYVQLGDLYTKTSNYDSAFYFYFLAENTWPENNYDGIAHNYRQIGRIYQYQGYFGKALDYYRKNLNIARQHNNEMGTAQAWDDIGIINFYYGKFDSALIYCNEGLKLREKNDAVLDIAISYGNIGLIHEYKHQYDTALINYFKALQIFKTLNEKNKIATCYNNIGNLYSNLNLYEKSREFHMQALNIRNEINDNYGIASSYLNIGISYAKQGEFNKAIENNIKALKIYEKSQYYQGLAFCLNQLGSSFRELGDSERALNYLRKSLKYYEELGNTNEQAKAYIEIGSIYLFKSISDSADYYFNKSFNINTLQNEGMTAEYYKTIGDKYYLVKDFNTAIKFYKNALTIYERMNDKGNALMMNSLIGIVFYDLGEYSITINYLEQSLASFKEYGMIDMIAKAALYLYKAYQKEGEYKKALENFLLYDAMSDSIFSEKNIEEITKMEMQYKFDRIQDEQKYAQLKKELDHVAELNKAKWQKKTAIITSVLIITLLSLVIVLIRVRQKQRVKSMKEEINLLMQRALSQQMNPHFIFNTLSSIQNYILISDKKTTTDYLSKFADLMRLVLNNSQHFLVPIKSEIDALKLYLDLEQLQLRNGFDYTIQIGENIDPLEYKIPALFIQPFVENSIKHGLSNKEGRGQISIQLEHNKDEIYCFIEDNGIGREKAAELRKNRDEKYKSLGTNITERRLRLISTLYKEKYHIKISDLKNNDKPTGTRVEFTFPVIV